MAAKSWQRKSRTPREAELLESAGRLIPAGVRNASVNPKYAMIVERGQGSKIYDTSGNEYIDYLLGSGPLFLGHAHPAVVAAVRKQLERGSSYLMVSEPAVGLAETIAQSVPGAEMVTFHNSGSESIYYAMRFARAYRGRDKILKFEGGYHGMTDYALMSTQWTFSPAEPPTPVANSAGIPQAVADTVLVAPFNDAERTADLIEKHADELAAIIVEPMQRTIPPRDGFLNALRELATRYDIPLIFDEVVTGFRLAFGGAQERYGVTADLVVLGKSISGGHPIGVLCGREDILSLANPRYIGSGQHVMQTGTFSANPVSAVAALACIAELSKPGVYDGVESRGQRLMAALENTLRSHNLDVQVTGEPSAFQPWFTREDVCDFRSMATADMGLGLKLVDLLLEQGVMKAHEKFFVSTAHDDDDITRTIEAFDVAAASLAAA